MHPDYMFSPTDDLGLPIMDEGSWSNDTATNSPASKRARLAW